MSAVTSKVSSLVACPLITSTSFMTGTGFMKCMPITFSGRPVTAAILVIGMEEVLEARIAPSLTVASRLRKMSSLRGSCSVTASTAKSDWARSAMSWVTLSRPIVSATVVSGMAPFFACRSRFCRMVTSAFSSCSGTMS